MKKIMFSDKFGLTQAVLEGRKTMTRRIIAFPRDWMPKEGSYITINVKRIKYQIGEIIAVAQSYKDAGINFIPNKDHEYGFFNFPAQQSSGWTSKIFTSADLLPHHIRITRIDMERLQDISDEDCLHEGIIKYEPDEWHGYEFFDYDGNKGLAFDTPRQAFASLIDKISGGGTWEYNPWVLVYRFELVD